MTYFLKRRAWLQATAALSVLAACPLSAQASDMQTGDTRAVQAQLMQLERALAGRLGVFALDTAHHAQLGYRAQERFPLCSTAKVLIVAGILQRSAQHTELMQQRVRYEQSELAASAYAPITAKHLAVGMTVAELCDAAIRYSDNAAANLLMRILGGPAGVTALARSIGDQAFCLDRWEPDLNACVPGDLRDTSTPEAMGRSLQRLALGDGLRAPQQQQLQTWLRGNTTGADCIRAGVPANWGVGDKTGAGAYGTRSDIAVLWPPSRPPIVLAVYLTQPEKNAKRRDDVIAAAARVVAGWVRTA